MISPTDIRNFIQSALPVNERGCMLNGDILVSAILSSLFLISVAAAF